MKSLMFVCTGNTCRSPMAEGLAKATLNGKVDDILSRGVSVYGPEKANPYAVQAMESKGINIRSHKSKAFEPIDVTEDMIILTMTRRHKDFLNYNYPRFISKTYTLLEYIGQDGDISDPYGLDQGVYDLCANQIEAAVKQLAAMFR